MIKKMIILFVSLCSLSSFAMTKACPPALPTSNPGFCSSFVAAATCYCSNSLPERMCMDMSKIYKRMIDMFGTIDRACNFQRETTPQACIDDWSCYLKGGKDSKGEACSSTGSSCV